METDATQSGPGSAPAVAEEVPAPLRDWLGIASVSSDPAYAAEVDRAGRWVVDYMAPAGGGWELRRPAGAVHPVVLGSLEASSQPAPHVLIYGHFDVLPAAPADEWETPPFSPTVRDGWLHARGAADSKANAFVLLTAARALARERRLPVNLTILCDGEEEIDGVAAAECIRDVRRLDAAIVCDGGMWRRGLPAFCIGTRGQISYHVSVSTGRDELHSGRFGGVALNAVHALMAALTRAAALPRELGTALRPEREDLETWSRVESGADLLAAAGAVPADSEAARNFHARTALGNALDVSGIQGGEPGQKKSIVPVRAHANLSMRLAAAQDVEEADVALRRALETGLPSGAQLSVRRLGSVPGASVDRDSAAVRLGARAMRKVFGVEPLLVRTGASIGVLAALAARGVPTVMTGFALPDSRVHAANERFPLEHLPLGIEATTELLLALKDLPRA